MKKVIKRNQVIITSLAILIAVAGYLDFADVDLGFRDKEASADSSSILDQVDYDISDESALVEENSQNSLSDTADDTDTTTPGEAVLTGASGFAAQAKLNICANIRIHVIGDRREEWYVINRSIPLLPPVR